MKSQRTHSSSLIAVARNNTTEDKRRGEAKGKSHRVISSESNLSPALGEMLQRLPNKSTGDAVRLKENDERFR